VCVEWGGKNEENGMRRGRRECRSGGEGGRMGEGREEEGNRGMRVKQGKGKEN